MDLFESGPQLMIRMGLKRVQIHSKRTRENNRILWYDAHSLPQIMQSDLADLHVVDFDLAIGRLEQPK